MQKKNAEHKWILCKILHIQFGEVFEQIIGENTFLEMWNYSKAKFKEDPQSSDFIVGKSDTKNAHEKLRDDILPVYVTLGRTNCIPPHTDSGLLLAFEWLKIPGINLAVLSRPADYEDVIHHLLCYFTCSDMGKKQFGIRIKLENRRDLKRFELLLDFLLLTVLVTESWPAWLGNTHESKKSPLISDVLLASIPSRPGSRRSKDFITYLEKFKFDEKALGYFAIIANFFYREGGFFWPCKMRSHAIEIGSFLCGNSESSPFYVTCNYLRKYYAYESRLNSASPITVASVRTKLVAVPIAVRTVPVAIPSDVCTIPTVVSTEPVAVPIVESTEPVAVPIVVPTVESKERITTPSVVSTVPIVVRTEPVAVPTAVSTKPITTPSVVCTEPVTLPTVGYTETVIQATVVTAETVTISTVQCPTQIGKASRKHELPINEDEAID